VGLGQAAMWTSDVKNRWAADWLRWPGYGQLFAQLARSLLRERALFLSGGAAGSGEGGYSMVTEVDAPAVHVTIDAVGGPAASDDRFANGLETTLEVTAAGQKAPERIVPLAQTAPGRYEGDFTLDRYGALALRAVHRAGPGGRVVAQSTGTVSVPYPREYLGLPPDRTLLGEAAAASGGRMDPSAEEHLDPGKERIPWRRERWQPLVYLGALLLVFDVLLRRVRIVR
jgi:Ca-activated chloride channel family protein